MMLAHFIIILLFVTTSSAFHFKVNIFEDGYYSVFMNGLRWLQSAPTYFIIDGERKNASDKSLILNETYSGQGTDQLGKFEFTNFNYMARHYTIDCKINIYNDDIALFSQNLHKIPNTRPASCTRDHKCYQQTTGAFPSFFVQAVHSVDLGYLNFGASSMGDDRKIIGRWGTNTTRLNGGMEGGIIVIFDSDGNTILMSPFDSFMSASFWHEKVPPTAGGRINWGVMGGVKSIYDHKQSFILVAADSINKAFEKFGNTLEKMYGTRAKRLVNIQNDISLKYLGYWTDNGGYYYYYTEKNRTYEVTILDIADYARKEKIPYRYIELDSWWYYQGYQGGVKQWTGRPDIFPDGIESIQEFTKWPIAGHNRYGAIDNVYAKQNGGDYYFLIQDSNPRVAVPKDNLFWYDLLHNATKWGLIMYEQDWLDWETNHSNDLQEDVYLGEIWLKQMGQAADRNGIPIQYCMSLQRHALASIQIPAVTQTRVSTDYHLSNDQWKIGISSLFANAIGFVPSKDNFATTSKPNGNPKYPEFVEMWPALQIAVATLSMGPVGPSDAIGKTDRDLLMRCCNDEGLILKPSKPALAIDKQLIKRAMPESNGPDGEVWTTTSTVFSDSSIEFGILFAANMSNQYTIKPEDTGFPYKLYRRTRVYPFNKPDKGEWFDLLINDLSLSGCTNTEFCLFYFSPYFKLGGDDITIYGELNKYVPISPQRIINMIVTYTNVIVDVTGVPSEKFSFAYELNGRLCILSETFTHTRFMRLSLIPGRVDHRKV